jgi:hypothetical protein
MSEDSQAGAPKGKQGCLGWSLLLAAATSAMLWWLICWFGSIALRRL